MQTALVFFMVASAVATLAVLARGIIIMARGQDVSGEQSNRMMSLRVALQALAIMFVVILFLVNRPA
ncbi:MAG: twin transmembrane helix small protein [Alphaproteobacteria bacterium]|nr:twin transmembrane helix small protein [Alphaproteobacteria bacterium]